MADTSSSDKKEKKKVPQVAGYDRGVRDFFRGSRGFSKPGGGGRSFIGMRRGSR